MNFNGAAKLLEHCFQNYVSFELCHFNSLQELDANEKGKAIFARDYKIYISQTVQTKRIDSADYPQRT